MDGVKVAPHQFVAELSRGQQSNERGRLGRLAKEEATGGSKVRVSRLKEVWEVGSILQFLESERAVGAVEIGLGIGNPSLNLSCNQRGDIGKRYVRRHTYLL